MLTREAESKLISAGKGQQYSARDIEIWNYIMINKKELIYTNGESGSINWKRFEACWRTAAAVATLLEPSQPVRHRTSAQLQERNKTIKNKK